MPIWLAPGIEEKDYHPSRRLEIYCGRTSGWILPHAENLAHEEDGGIPSLIICTSVFEPIGAIRGGTNSESRFKSGFEYVFPESSKFSHLAYDRLRNGLFHLGFIKWGLIIQDHDKPVEESGGIIFIDPKRFAKAVRESFSKFCAEVKSDSELSGRFDAYFDKQAEQTKRATITPDALDWIERNRTLSTSGSTFDNTSHAGATPPVRFTVPPKKISES
jgi:hypothetical protein